MTIQRNPRRALNAGCHVYEHATFVIHGKGTDPPPKFEMAEKGCVFKYANRVTWGFAPADWSARSEGQTTTAKKRCEETGVDNLFRLC